MNRISAAVRRRAPRGDAGVSLVELLIVMLLSGLVLTIAASMFVNVARITVDTGDERESTAHAANIMDVVSTDIRASTNLFSGATTTFAVLAATRDSMTIITYTDAGPSFGSPYQIRFRMSAGRLVEDRWNPSAAAFPRTSAPTASRVLGEQVLNTRLFRYFDSTGAEIAAPGSGMTATDRARVASIEVTLEVVAPDSTRSVVLVNNVGMPNMQVSRTDD